MARWAVVFMVVAIGIATLTPGERQEAPAPWYCLVCDEGALVDALLNVIMFIPLGIALRAAGMRAWRAILLCAVLSTCVETMQGTVIPGRDPSLRDAITNTLGAALGVSIAASWRTFVVPTRTKALVYASVAATAWLMVITLTGLAVRPCVPAGPYDGSWSPSIPGESKFGGRVVEATFGGTQWPNGPAPSNDVIEQQLRTSRFVAHAVVEPDPDRSSAAPILSLSGFQRIAVLVSHSGRRLTVSLPQCAIAFRLRPPLYALPLAFTVNALDGQPATRVAIDMDVEPDRITLAARAGGGGESRSETIPITPFAGWSVLRPFFVTEHGGTRALTWIWLAGGLVPFGYWLARAGWAGRAQRSAGHRRTHSVRSIVISILVLVIGLELLPALLSVSRAGVPELIAGAAGCVAGALLARRVERVFA